MKCASVMTAVVLAMLLSIPSAGRERSGIDPKYTWDLTGLYENVDRWEDDFKWLESQVPKYKPFEGTLGTSSSALLAALKFDEQVTIRFLRLRSYASLSSDLDTRNQKNQAMVSRVSDLASQLSVASSFMKPEILAIPEATLAQFLQQTENLRLYKQFFDNMLRTKSHTLPKEQEALLALSSPVQGACQDTFSILTNADLTFPTVKDPEGNDYKITPGKYYAAMYSTDRSFRKRVYQGFYQPYMAQKNTFASLFTGNMKSLVFKRKARKYNSTLEAALTANNIPLRVYDSLIDTTHQNLAPLQRWCRLKQKVLGLEEMHPYDTYVTLFPGVKTAYSYDEGKDLALASLKPLGQKYADNLNLAFDNRWIDVHETPGKRSGAYSSGTIYGTHPYVLLNWNNELNDVFTLSHEMGHNMHSYFTGETQPFVYADYSIFVAEVASTLNEALLLDYLIAHAQTREEKMALIEQNLNNMQTTFYRQTRFAEFERKVHALTEGGKALTPDELTQMFSDMYQQYWGDGVTVDPEEGYSWARVPHFYYNFYVYQYATSFAASQALAAKIKKEGQPAIDAYLEFLKSGESSYPIDLLKKVGVDMNSPEPFLAVANKMNALLDQLEQLLEEKE